MSDVNEVKRWSRGSLLEFSNEGESFVRASDHDRIVAELKTTISQLKENEVQLKETTARQVKVIEKLREQRERYAKDLQEVCGTPNSYKRDEQELEAIEKGEGM